MLKENRFAKIPGSINLYILTHPLAEGREEGEIEHLFTEGTRLIKLRGNPFLKNLDEKPIEKDALSCYVTL